MNRKQLKTILILAAIHIVALLILHSAGPLRADRRDLMKVKKIQINSRVVRSFVDVKDHSEPNFKLQDSSSISHFIIQYDVAELINVNDSIVKLKDGLILYIYRNDQLFKSINYDSVIDLKYKDKTEGKLKRFFNQ